MSARFTQLKFTSSICLNSELLEADVPSDGHEIVIFFTFMQMQRKNLNNSTIKVIEEKY